MCRVDDTHKANAVKHLSICHHPIRDGLIVITTVALSSAIKTSIHRSEQAKELSKHGSIMSFFARRSTYRVVLTCPTKEIMEGTSLRGPCANSNADVSTVQL